MEIRNEPNVRQEQRLMRIIVISSALAIVLGTVLFLIANFGSSEKSKADNDDCDNGPNIYCVSGNINSSGVNNAFDDCDDGDTIKLTGTLNMNTNSNKLQYKDVIILLNGNNLHYTSKKFFKLGSGAKLFCNNGGSITASSGNCHTNSCIYFGSTKKASCTGSAGVLTFAQVNEAGGVEASGITALPVELIRFDAVKGDEHIDLSWATASEVNNSHFEVEKSYDAKTWVKIGEVKGNGNSQAIIKYAFTDEAGLGEAGQAFYRLKQVDFDGVFEYSYVRHISGMAIEKEKITSVYPNPANQFVNVKIDEFGLFNIELTDAAGNVRLRKETSEPVETLQIGEFPTGIYYIHVIGDDLKESHKIVIRH